MVHHGGIEIADLYTGWPNKNATPEICHFNDLIDKLSLIVFYYYYYIVWDILFRVKWYQGHQFSVRNLILGLPL